MIIRQVAVGSMANFTYVIQDDSTPQCIVVDPSWDLNLVQAVLDSNHLKLKYIVNTHHHFDHTLGNEALARITRAKIVQHPSSGLPHDISVDEGDSISFGESSLDVLHTPGHSQDGICLVGHGSIFTGDTLFVGSCGRTDLPGGDAGMLYDSLMRLASMDGSLDVYPGHNYGASIRSTISQERLTNPALQHDTRRSFLDMMGVP